MLGLEPGQVMMTAAHVVQTAEAISVRFLSGETIPARVLSSEPRADVALIQLERLPQVARVARLGDSNAARVGDQVFVVGAPFGISQKIDTLVKCFRTVAALQDERLAPLRPGNLLLECINLPRGYDRRQPAEVCDSPVKLGLVRVARLLGGLLALPARRMPVGLCNGSAHCVPCR